MRETLSLSLLPADVTSSDPDLNLVNEMLPVNIFHSTFSVREKLHRRSVVARHYGSGVKNEMI